MKALVDGCSMMLVLTIGVLLTTCKVVVAEVKAERPNVIIVLADDLGENDLGCYGRKDQHTPHLDKLAAAGMRFTSFYCALPICSPSRAALLTGKSPARLHLTNYLPGRPDTRAQPLLQPKIRQHLPLEEQTLAEVLKGAGYATACIGKWHLGGKAFGPGQQGFEVVFAGRANTQPSATEGGKGEYELTAHAEEFITAHRDRPFFLYLAHNNPHIPLAAKPELVAKNRNAFNPLYAAVVETLDDSVGRLLARVDSLGLRGRTIVVFASDNGGLHVPELRDDPPTYNTPFRAGKGFLYEGGLRVPLLVRWPGRIRPGSVTAIPVVNTDLMPTLLELLGLELPHGLDGVSFARLLLGTGELPPRTLFWHFPHYTNQGGRPAGAVREGDWKLIEHYEHGRLELFNLARDPGETRNLSAEQPQRAATLKGKLAAWRKSVGAQECTANPDFDPALYKKLYVDTDVSRLQPAATAAEMTRTLAAWRKGIDAVVRQKRPMTKECPSSNGERSPKPEPAGGHMAVWGAENGILFVNGRGGGWLMTDKEYSDFELRLEYKLPQRGNSGVALRSPMKGDPAYVGMEIQILDDAWHKEHLKGLRRTQLTGSIYDVVPPAKEVTKPIGEWNQMQITAKGRHITVVLNGTKIVDANLDDYKNRADRHRGLLRTKGHLGLQSHDGRVEFRNLFVKPL